MIKISGKDSVRLRRLALSAQGLLKDRSFGNRSASQFSPCRFPNAGAEASIMWAQDELYALVAIPLRTTGVLEGGLVAIERLGSETLATWSEMFGAVIDVAPIGTPANGELSATVRSFPEIDIRVSTTYDAERNAIARSRRNLVLSGVAALLLAIVASLVLARPFAEPIVKMTKPVV